MNDNDGELFHFKKIRDKDVWITQNAIEKTSLRKPLAFDESDEDERALASVSPTDVLIAGVHTWPKGVFADPLRVEGRAALYSLGFMVRRVAAVRLDIADSELKVGLRTTCDNAGTVTGQNLPV